ncbi:MAG: hypothetical protein IJ833_08015 [Lachnospiraceae bacterium]|nr:hypothetical protein [Lachnospiraceae bacterium]
MKRSAGFLCVSVLLALIVSFLPLEDKGSVNLVGDNTLLERTLGMAPSGELCLSDEDGVEELSALQPLWLGQVLVRYVARGRMVIFLALAGMLTAFFYHHYQYRYFALHRVVGGSGLSTILGYILRQDGKK